MLMLGLEFSGLVVFKVFRHITNNVGFLSSFRASLTTRDHCSIGLFIREQLQFFQAFYRFNPHDVLFVHVGINGLNPSIYCN